MVQHESVNSGHRIGLRFCLTSLFLSPCIQTDAATISQSALSLLSTPVEFANQYEGINNAP